MATINRMILPVFFYKIRKYEEFLCVICNRAQLDMEKHGKSTSHNGKDSRINGEKKLVTNFGNI